MDHRRLTLVTALVFISSVQIGASSAIRSEIFWKSFAGPEDYLYEAHSCVPIPANMTLCNGMLWGKMQLPNLMGQETVQDAILASSGWLMIRNVDCHKSAIMFLCSLYAPICHEKPVYPCRSMCDDVKRKCEPFIRAYGFEWPVFLACNKFPEDNDMCMREPTTNDAHENNRPYIGVPATTSLIPFRNPQQPRKEPSSTNRPCDACVPNTNRIMEKFCAADIVIKSKLTAINQNGKWIEIQLNKKRKLLKGQGQLTSKQRKHMMIILNEFNQASQQGQGQSQPQQQQQQQQQHTGHHNHHQQTQSQGQQDERCQCDAIQSLDKANQYLLMGKLTKDTQLTLTHLSAWPARESKEFKKILKKIRKASCPN